jgi:hypothetical protein
VTDEALESLREIPASRARLDSTELELIDQARRAGATWADIASALGLSSRQAAEQRRLRLATSTIRLRQHSLDFPAAVAALRDAAAELDRRIGADRHWDRRFLRATLVRMTLNAAVTAPPGGLFALVSAAVGDLASCGVTFPRPTAAAVDRLRAALLAAAPKH